MHDAGARRKSRHPATKRDKGLVLITAVAHLTWRINRFFPGLVDFYNRRGWRSRGPIIPEDETPERSVQ